jgi:CRISPR-associated protein Cmr3
VTLLIKPLEPFFFRDARPFDKGEGWATGIFPPLPSTIYGAVRTAAISQKSTIDDYNSDRHIAIREEMGSPGYYGTFAIKSVLLYYGYYCLVPMPLDLLQKKDQKRLGILLPNPRGDKIISDRSFTFYQADPDFKTPTNPWLDGYGLASYLSGEPPTRSNTWNPLYEEIKTGIEKDPEKGNAMEHMLYVQKMLRLEDNEGGHYEFSVDMESISSLDERGILKLGHDGRVFSYEKTTEGNFDFLANKINAIKSKIDFAKQFKLLFTSPVLLKNGWLPGGVKDLNDIWETGSVAIRIKSAVLGKPMRVGGWDMKKGGPKPMRKAVPPGSVYYCELAKGTVDALFDTLFDKNISDADDDLARQGFGHTLIGVMQH